MKKNISISIIITYYNAKDIIYNAIQSIDNQDFDKNKYEILIIDDCSNDKESIKVLENIKQNRKDIKIIRNNINLGVGGAKHTGVEHANYNIIANLDCDDTFPPNTLKIIAEEFSKRKIDFLVSNYYKKSINNIVDISHLITNDYLDFYKLFNNNWIIIGSAPFKKEFFIQNNLIYKYRQRIDDVHTLKNAIRYGAVFGYTKHILYNWNDDNPQSDGHTNYHIDHLLIFFKHIDLHLKYMTNLNFIKKLLNYTLKIILIKLNLLK